MPHKPILRFAKLGGIVLPFLDSSNQNLNQETCLWCVFVGVGEGEGWLIDGGEEDREVWGTVQLEGHWI